MTVNTTYTEEELNEFCRLVEMTESLRQMDRIEARLNMPKFLARAGKEKCDAMFEILKQEVA